MVFPQTILPLSTEIFVDGAWVDITSKVYSRDPITISRGRANEASSTEPADMRLTVNNRNGDMSPRNPRSPYYGKIGRNTPIRQSVVGPGFLLIDSATGNTPAGGAYVSTPDASSLDMAGGVDIDLRFDADLTSWRESMELVSKWNSGANQRSYALDIRSDGLLVFWFTEDGITGKSKTSTVPVPVTNGRIAVRGVLDSDNGGGGWVISFWTAPTIDGTWTQLGDYQFDFTGVATVFNSTAAVRLLDNPDSVLAGSIIRGKVYAAQLYAGPTLVANADFSVVAHGATSFVDSTSKTWTLTGDVEVSTHDVRFSGEIPSWPQKWDPSGKDVYTTLEAAGILRRLGQGSAPLTSVLRQGINTLTDLVAYWPMEDTEGSTRLAAGISGGVPMTAISTSPDFGADDSFKASKPIPNMALTACSAVVRPYTSTGNIQVRFLMHIPTGGAANGAVIARIYSGGTAARWDLVYGTGGTLALNPYDSSDVAIGAGSGAIGFSRDGAIGRISVALDTVGSDVSWSITSLNVGDTTGGTVSATLSSRTVGACTKVILNANKLLDDTSIGHLTVETAIDSIYDLATQLNAYTGETAGRRIQRLCREQGITVQGDGDLDDTEPMGPQLPKTFLELIQECAEADLGILYEPRDQLALGYRPRSALYTQPADVTLSYAAHQLNSLEPVEDDQLLRNDITTSRKEGSSARATMTDGPLSVQAPPLGVGTYDDAIEVNVENDSQLDDQAGWRLRLGTIDEARFPSLSLNLANASFTADVTALRETKAADIGSRVVIEGPLPTWLPPEDISQVIQGTTEILSQYQWDMTWNLSPGVPYDSIGVYYDTNNPSVFVARYSSDGTVISAPVGTGDASIDVSTPSGPVWTHVDGDFDINVTGERMTVTAISGSGSAQTFTVNRGVNGVIKTHSVNDAVDLFEPAYYAL